jgi:REP element-mobilizing transposase RayT
MPRPHRSTPAGYCYHVLNRGNARQQVFRKDADYAAFVRLFADAHERLSMRILALGLMPNHFHLVLSPRADGDLSRWMHSARRWRGGTPLSWVSRRKLQGGRGLSENIFQPME